MTLKHSLTQISLHSELSHKVGSPREALSPTMLENLFVGLSADNISHVLVDGNQFANFCFAAKEDGNNKQRKMCRGGLAVGIEVITSAKRQAYSVIHVWRRPRSAATMYRYSVGFDCSCASDMSLTSVSFRRITLKQ